jgi:hypothetical protein
MGKADLGRADCSVPSDVEIEGVGTESQVVSASVNVAGLGLCVGGGHHSKC